MRQIEASTAEEKQRLTEEVSRPQKVLYHSCDSVLALNSRNKNISISSRRRNNITTYHNSHTITTCISSPLLEKRGVLDGWQLQGVAETPMSDCCAMPLPLLPESAANSVGDEARKPLSDENGETEMF
jgi:hypothetical protein